MGDQGNPEPRAPAPPEAGSQDTDPAAAGGTSRRDFLTSGAGLLAGGAAAGMLPGRPLAQAGGAVDTDAELRGLRGQRRILLRGGLVLTLDPAVGDFEQADVLIEGGKIREVRPNISVAGDAAVVDAANRIVLPGFVDTHHHSYQGILRNILPNGILADYFRDITGLLTPPYEARDAYAGVLVSALGAIEQGITTVVDTSQVSHTPEHTDACIRAFQEAGLRVLFAYSRGAGPAAQHPEDMRRLRRQFFASEDQLLTLALQAGFTNTSFWPLARELGVPIVEHVVGGATSPASTTILELAQARQLGPDVEFIHCTGLTEAAWQAIVDHGVHVSIAVPIEMAMRHGMPPIQQALNHGIRPSLSSDVDTNITQDPFTQMRTAFVLQRALVNERALAGEENLPPLLTVRDVLECATIEGARGAHLDRKVGTLRPGKDADVVLLRADRLNVWPLNNAPGAVVNLMDSSNVDAVFIAGEVKKWRGSLVGVDVPRVLRLIQESRDAVLRRAGFPLNLVG